MSKPVKKYKEIKEDAEKMKRFVVMGDFKGFYNKAYAVCHCQVSETPMSFFVVDPNCVIEQMFKARVIINPKIIKAEDMRKLDESVSVPNTIEYDEPCLSFPFRKPKKTLRHDTVEVEYQIPVMGGLRLKTVRGVLNGIASEIFQHEVDHTNGKNIYFSDEEPVEWWKLIGTDKSKGGSSLESPESLNLKQSKQTHIYNVTSDGPEKGSN